ncbi:MAG TPA: putative toxin-antitoxin system toxin component, PIN family [Opitutaceae bacterium]|jgi:putative PIN family toxin of toxin-antitoxin system|nr:putative toxin-antitoxin system toxin component, PIN family [Opitutaceae bacterium]
MRQWVIDTNVVVSGLLNPHGPSARVLDAVLDGRVKLVYDARILAEYRDVLYRPRLKLAPDKIQAFLNGLRGQVMVTPRALVVTSPDSDDVFFVEAALATTDQTIVTGNLAHYPPEILHGARVLTPAQAAVELAQGAS